MQRILPRAGGIAVGTDGLTVGFWEKASREEFENHTWQDKQAITQFPQLATALDGIVRHEALKDMEAGLLRAGMSMRLTNLLRHVIDRLVRSGRGSDQAPISSHALGAGG
jgi:hypothetical protein